MKPSTMYSILTESTELTDLHAEYEYSNGLVVPAIFRNQAEQTSKFPYTVFRFDSITGNHWNKNTRYCYFDSFDKGGSWNTLEDIARELKNLLHKLKTSDEDWGAIRVEFDNDDEVPEEEDDVLHYHARYKISAWDKRFIENSNNI